jgi:hypothetical protein
MQDNVKDQYPLKVFPVMLTVEVLPLLHAQ